MKQTAGGPVMKAMLEASSASEAGTLVEPGALALSQGESNWDWRTAISPRFQKDDLDDDDIFDDEEDDDDVDDDLDDEGLDEEFDLDEEELDDDLEDLDDEEL
jgi:hypothetical protein